MSCGGAEDCTCGCCTGVAVETPQGEYNVPGLSAIAYRTGTWGSFFDSMSAELSSSQYVALGALKTRDSDDFSVALLDATSVVLDILTFYQERLANESYLRTATQLDSLTELSRLIGYKPSPGVGASTYLAFALRAAVGLPSDPAAKALVIPAGTQVQSVPAQGQTPQSFQTSSDILAKADWNALPVQTGMAWAPASKQNTVMLEGTATQLNPGDVLLIVGDERLQKPGSKAWAAVHVTRVQVDASNARTWVEWAEPLSTEVPKLNPQIFAMRLRAALFGYNAMKPIVLLAGKVDLTGLIDSSNEWTFGTAQNSSPKNLAGYRLIDLDAAYNKVAQGSWVVVSDETKQDLFQAAAVETISRTDYMVSAKITRVTGDQNGHLSMFYERTRSAAVLAQSEVLPTAEQPLGYPLYGTQLDLQALRPDLQGVTAVAVTGKNPRLVVDAAEKNGKRDLLTFVPDDDPSNPITLVQGQSLRLLQPPNTIVNDDGSIPEWSTVEGEHTLVVADPNGRTGTLTTALNNLALSAPLANDPVVQECALVGSSVLSTDGGSHTRILLKQPLQNVYHRATASVNCNVGAATAGSGVTELLGSGSGSSANQYFVLKQTPLTYVSAPTPTGSESTLEVQVNGAAWQEVQTLYEQPPTAKVYTTLNLSSGKTQVIFGDGVEGATLPSGSNNVRASYRVGLGIAGNVPAGAISTLVDRPTGVSGVTNPVAATGGQDAQDVEGIRTNAPQSVLTLGRAVSLLDYQNFAATFAGIGKATALWLPNGRYRGVFLTVAAADGSALPASSRTFANLQSALQAYGNPNVALFVNSYVETTFGLAADILYDPAYTRDDVQAAVMARLRTTYSFANRTFGQGVTYDEISSLIQGVPGVVAVNVTALNVLYSSAAGDIGSAAFSVAGYNAWRASAISPPLSRPQNANANGICPYVPTASLTGLPQPAEILVLDPDAANVKLGVMQ